VIPDEPRASNTVNLGMFSCYPFHFIEALGSKDAISVTDKIEWN
jgi:hypothetical protein